MAHNKSIFKNYIFNLIKTFSSIVFPVVTFAYASRVLGAEGVGKVNFAKSVITYFVMFASLGMNYYGTREAAKLRDDKDQLSKFVQEMLIINGVTTLLSYVLLAASMIFVKQFSGYEDLLLINSVSVILQGMGMEWLYQALEEYRYIAVRSVIFQALALLMMFALVRDQGDTAQYAFVYVFATSGSYLLNFVNARKLVVFRRYKNYRFGKHIRPLLWLFAMAVSIELYTVMDTTMLGLLSGDIAVGKYTAAVKVNKLVNTLITSLGVVLIPRLSYYIGQRNNDEVVKLIGKSYNFVFMLSVPACFGLYVLSDDIIRLFSGAEFASAAQTMRILVPIVLIIPFSVVTNQQTFVPMGKEKLILLSTLVGAVTNFICNMMLIPRYAENGAAAATVLTEIIVAVICLRNISGYYDRKKIFAKYYQYVFGALPILLIGRLADVLQIHYLLRMAGVAAASVLVYACLLLAFHNEYASDAASRLKEILRRKRM